MTSFIVRYLGWRGRKMIAGVCLPSQGLCNLTEPTLRFS